MALESAVSTDRSSGASTCGAVEATSDKLQALQRGLLFREVTTSADSSPVSGVEGLDHASGADHFVYLDVVVQNQDGPLPHGLPEPNDHHPALALFAHQVDNSVDDPAGRLFADRGARNVGEERPDLADGQSVGIQPQQALREAGEAALTLLQNLWLECPVAVPKNIDCDLLSCLSRDRLGSGAAAHAPVRAGTVLLMSEVFDTAASHPTQIGHSELSPHDPSISESFTVQIGTYP